MSDTPAELLVTREGHVATVLMHRPPNNYVDHKFLRALVAVFSGLAADEECRSVVLASDAKHFCAGANFALGSVSAARSDEPGESGQFYKTATQLFRFPKPIVAAVNGAAVGAGLGIALAADFRVTCPEARFSANFVQLGLHPGFGLTVTLPDLLGRQAAAKLLLTGRRLTGEQAAAIGLVDELVPASELRAAATALATELAAAAPLAVRSTRATLRRGLADAVEVATEREFVEQDWLGATEDFRTGIAAGMRRERPVFKGR